MYQGILFNCIYDANKVLLAKNAMQKYNTLDLKKKDLVLLETHIMCYRQKDKNGRWTIHCAQFELQAILILQTAPYDNGAPDENLDIEIAYLHI